LRREESKRRGEEGLYTLPKPPALPSSSYAQISRKKEQSSHISHTKSFSSSTSAGERPDRHRKFAYRFLCGEKRRGRRDRSFLGFRSFYEEEEEEERRTCPVFQCHFGFQDNSVVYKRKDWSEQLRRFYAVEQCI
jgi:hypothetical protein